jgi:hypothetical protein
MVRSSPLVLMLLAAACCPAPVVIKPGPEEIARVCAERVPPPDPGPAAVVEQFLRAIDQKDCTALVAAAPPEVRSQRSSEKLVAGCQQRLAELGKLAAEIRASAAAPRKVSDNRAELPYGEHQTLVLVRRAERWYVEDL